MFENDGIIKLGNEEKRNSAWARVSLFGDGVWAVIDGRKYGDVSSPSGKMKDKFD